MTVQQLKIEIANNLDKAFFKFQEDLSARFPEGSETVSARDIMKLASKLRVHIKDEFNNSIPPIDVK